MAHQSPYYSSEHPGKPPGLGHSPLGPNTAVDYKSKEPPLDLMNKPNPHQQQQQQPLPPQPGQPPHQQQLPPGDTGPQQNKDCPSGPPPHAGTGKLMQHFYPYGYVCRGESESYYFLTLNFYLLRYMPTGYNYNMDPNYGPVSMMSEESKLSQQQGPNQGQIKEERIKESSSPNEYAKMGPQVISRFLN